MNRRTLTEREFREVETARKNDLAELIRRSGLNYSYIAAQTGVGRKAVKRALDCDGIRLDTAVRLEYFLEWYIQNKKTE